MHICIAPLGPKIQRRRYALVDCLCMLQTCWRGATTQRCICDGSGNTVRQVQQLHVTNQHSHAATSLKPFKGHIKIAPLYSNMVIGTPAVDGWDVTFCTAQRGLGAWAAVPPSPFLAVPYVTAQPSTASVPASYYLMWHYNCQCPLRVNPIIDHTGNYFFAMSWTYLLMPLLVLQWSSPCNGQDSKGRLKMQDRKMTDKSAGLENAGLENDGQKCRTGKCRTGK